jgi:hypothetical protein
MVGSISNSSNMHEVIDDNSNYYRSIVMDAMRKIRVMQENVQS